jgi:hypothetical protein
MAWDMTQDRPIDKSVDKRGIAVEFPTLVCYNPAELELVS